jgi:hypothetical protein
VPGKRVSMRKTREVLRLYFDLTLGQRQIARSANVSQSTGCGLGVRTWRWNGGCVTPNCAATLASRTSTTAPLDRTLMRSLANDSAWVERHEHDLHHRANRRGQKLFGLCCLPRWSPGAVYPRCGAVPRPRRSSC